MYRSGTRISMLTGLVTGTTLALAYLFVAMQGIGRHRSIPAAWCW